MDFTLIGVLALAAGAVLLAIAFLILEFYMVLLGPLKGAPYVPSSKEKIVEMIDLAEIKPNEVVLDLGSGNGNVLIAAARKGAIAIGIEINPFLVWYARRRIKNLGLDQRIKIIRGDFKNYPLNNADVIFLYLWTSTMAKLEDKLRVEAKPDARIISNRFEIPGWTPMEIKNGVYRYHPELAAFDNYKIP